MKVICCLIFLYILFFFDPVQVGVLGEKLNFLEFEKYPENVVKFKNFQKRPIHASRGQFRPGGRKRGGYNILLSSRWYWRKLNELRRGSVANYDS